MVQKIVTKTEYFKVNSKPKKVANARGGSGIVVNPNLTNWMYNALTSHFSLPMDKYLQEYRQLLLKIKNTGSNTAKTKHMTMTYLDDEYIYILNIFDTDESMIMTIKGDQLKGVITANVRNRGKMVTSSKHVQYTQLFPVYMVEVFKRIGVSF